MNSRTMCHRDILLFEVLREDLLIHGRRRRQRNGLGETFGGFATEAGDWSAGRGSDEGAGAVRRRPHGRQRRAEATELEVDTVVVSHRRDDRSLDGRIFAVLALTQTLPAGRPRSLHHADIRLRRADSCVKKVEQVSISNHRSERRNDDGNCQ